MPAGVGTGSEAPLAPRAPSAVRSVSRRSLRDLLPRDRYTSAEFPAGELDGIPGSGKTLSWNEAVYSLVEDGKVFGGRLVVAGVERLQQLGVLPEPRRELPD